MERKNDGRSSLRLTKAPINLPEPQQVLAEIQLNQLTLEDGGEAIPMSHNDFTIVKKLGEGNFGCVDQVEHALSKRIFAVKKIWIITRQREMNQLKDELLNMMKARNHSFIVHFHGALVDEGFCWIFMEKMDCSLQKFYQTVHNTFLPLPECVLMRIAICAIEGLDHLKKLTIIHRDIKPANILINRGGTAKLCDFGVSGQLVNSVRASKEKGTQYYYSPERLKGPNYGVQADIWALGLTLTEVANGRFPFRRWTNDFQQREDLLGKTRKDPEAVNESFSAECRRFISGFLNYSLEERPKYPEIKADQYFCQMKDKDYEKDYFARVIDAI